LKLIPAFLIIFPLWRRDRRWVGGLVVGLLVLLVAVPSFLLGINQALQSNEKFVRVMIRPSLATNVKADRAKEMFHVLKTDNQSIQAVLHAWQNWGETDAPAQPNGPTRAIHWIIGFGFTGVTLASVWRRRFESTEILLLLSSLVVVMLLISPMSHLHYYCLTLPLVMALLNEAWVSPTCKRGFWPGNGLAAMLALHVVGGAFPLIFVKYRNLGFAPLTTLPLWFMAIRILWQRRQAIVEVLPFTTMAAHRKAA
jgi:hypothetical protein